MLSLWCAPLQCTPHPSRNRFGCTCSAWYPLWHIPPPSTGGTYIHTSWLTELVHCIPPSQLRTRTGYDLSRKSDEKRQVWRPCSWHRLWYTSHVIPATWKTHADGTSALSDVTGRQNSCFHESRAPRIITQCVRLLEAP